MPDASTLMPFVSIGSSLIVGIGSSYLTFRLQLAAFMAMDKEREKHWSKWRDGITEDVAALKQAVALPALAVLVERVSRVEKDAEALRHWKHSVDPYIERKVQP
jgi:hypothetical protein